MVQNDGFDSPAGDVQASAFDQNKHGQCDGNDDEDDDDDGGDCDSE